MAFWFGVRTTFSLFFVALIDTFRWGRAETAMAQSIAMGIYMILAPIVGTLVDRIGPRRAILPGIALTGLGFLLCTQIKTLLQFYLFFGIIVGIGVTCLSITPFTTILTHWFERKRGMANGLASVGIGLGPLLLLPFLQYLITHQGWAFTYLVFGLMILAIPLPLNLFFLRHQPQEMGLLPDGDRPKNPVEVPQDKSENLLSEPSLAPLRERSFGEFMKMGRFWLILIFPSLTVFGVYTVIVHHVKYLVDLGLEKMWVATLFAMASALSGGFRFFWGWLSDRIGREMTYTLGGICFCFAIVFLLIYPPFSNRVLLYLFAISFGAGWGVTAPMFMSISADLFKGKFFGTFYGMVEGVIGIGGALGSWLGGYLFDQTQSYFWAFFLVIPLNLISILLVWLAAPRKYQNLRPVEFG